MAVCLLNNTGNSYKWNQEIVPYYFLSGYFSHYCLQISIAQNNWFRLWPGNGDWKHKATIRLLPVITAGPG
jgi:hypothetical protein